MSAPQIEIQSLRLVRGSRPIFEGLDLAIKRSDRVAIVGASGVGKSTLLAAIAGLTPFAGGSVVVDGRSVAGPARSVTMMLQRPALLPWANVLDNVLLGLRFSGEERRDPAGARKSAIKLLERVGLADRLSAKPAELSGGEQQRVALARALAPLPSVLLLDEPFSALDPATRSALRADVARLSAESGITLLLVTHDMGDASAMCRRIVRLDGRPARIVADDRVANDTSVPADRDRLATAA
jgi:NitT/TauT family transport system ATP-binding protein